MYTITQLYVHIYIITQLYEHMYTITQLYVPMGSLLTCMYAVAGAKFQ